MFITGPCIPEQPDSYIVNCKEPVTHQQHGNHKDPAQGWTPEQQGNSGLMGYFCGLNVLCIILFNKWYFLTKQSCDTQDILENWTRLKWLAAEFLYLLHSCLPHSKCFWLGSLLAALTWCHIAERRKKCTKPFFPAGHVLIHIAYTRKYAGPVCFHVSVA